MFHYAQYATWLKRFEKCAKCIVDTLVTVTHIPVVYVAKRQHHIGTTCVANI